MWIILAFISAVSAGLVSVTVKAGMKNVDSVLGTFLRTLVVLIFSFIMVLITRALPSIKSIALKEWLFIAASGLCTGLSWLCYFKALTLGDINKVVPIDKLSGALAMVLAIIILKEPYSWLTFVSMAVMIAGTMLMITKKNTLPQSAALAAEEKAAEPAPAFPGGAAALRQKPNGIRSFIAANMWLVLAVLSLIFASLTSILAKIGMQKIDSNAGTMLRTVVVVLMSFFIALFQKKLPGVKKMKTRDWIFLVVSGILTGISWLCYYAAIQTGNVSVVVPIDKLSILVTVLFSYIMFKEKLSPKAIVGLILLTAGTLLLLINI